MTFGSKVHMFVSSEINAWLSLRTNEENKLKIHTHVGLKNKRF